MILQGHLPHDLTPRPLPGIAPVGNGPWLLVDAAYAGPMAERCRLLRDHRDEVVSLQPSAREAATELLETVLATLPDGFHVGTGVTCPDGRFVEIAWTDPLGTLGQIVQEDAELLNDSVASISIDN